MMDDSAFKLTPLTNLGEFEIINHLTKNVSIRQPSTIKGVGDDAAVVEMKDKYMVITTDMLLESFHFDVGYVPMKNLGYKAVAVNLSDIYAMNAMATQITFSFAVPNRFTLESLEDLYSGIELASSLYNVDLVGGDTSASTIGLMISVTAIGEVKKNDVVYRSGAKPNDLLVVTGDLGGAYVGLKALQRERELYMVNYGLRSSLEDYIYPIERQLKPQARKDIINFFKKSGVKPSSMIDISDGLSSEVIHLCTASKTGCELYEAKFPIDPQVIAICDEFQLNTTSVVLNGGEDYELLFTIPEETYPRIKRNPNFTVIGRMTDAAEGIHLIDREGKKTVLRAMGWSALPSKKR